MEKRRKLLKSAGAVGLVTALSRIFGYVRDATLAWALGATSSMDAFAVAYRLVNLFRRLVAEGAMSAAFVPVFVQYRQEHTQEELWHFARKFFYTLALAVSAVVLIEMISASVIVRVMAPGFIGVPGKLALTIFLTRLMAPYLIFVALTALAMGILNAFGYFAVPAFGPVFFNVAVIAAVFSSTYLTPNPVVGIAIGVVIGGVLQFVSQMPLLSKIGMQFKFGLSLHHPAIRKVGILLAPSVFGIGIVQINVLVDSLMASLLREGSVSQIYYADRVMELVLGIFVVSLTTVILPEMSQSAAQKNIGELKGTLLFSLRAVSFIAIPAGVGLFLLSDPIVHVLFERGRFLSVDTERTAVALAYYALGLYFTATLRILVSAFYAVQDTKTPVKIAFVSLITNAILDWILMHPLKQGGLALSTSITSALSFFLLLYMFQKHHGSFEWQKFRKGVVKICAASVAMGIFCLVALRVLFRFDIHQPLSWKVVSLFGTIALGLLVYLGIALVLRMDELKVFKRSALPT